MELAASAGQPRQWADYSYAHGGKDGTPFPVDRATYDRNILVLTEAVRKARLGQSDKFHALRRLALSRKPIMLGIHGNPSAAHEDSDH